jgi:predicted RNA methylase
VIDYLNADDDIGQKYILDVGCGTGRWYVPSSPLSTRCILMERAYEVAQSFPDVNVRNPSSRPDK